MWLTSAGIAQALVEPRVAWLVEGGWRGHPGCVFDAESPQEPLGSSGGSRGDAERWWTPKRVALLGWLEESAPALAPLYRGALLLAMRDGFPGRAHFIAHAMREIRNRLPGALGPEVRFRGAGYEDRTATVHKRWVAEGLPEDGSLPLPEASAPSASGPSRRDVSVEFLASVGRLIEGHIEALANREARETSGFRVLAAGGPVPRYAVKNWLNLFPDVQRFAHAGDEPLPAEADSEWVRNFFAFEEFLMALVKPSHENLDDLDRLLDETNRR